MIFRCTWVMLLLGAGLALAQADRDAQVHWDPLQRELPLSAKLGVLSAPVMVGEKIEAQLTITNLSAQEHRIPRLEYSIGRYTTWTLKPPQGDVDPIPSEIVEQFFGGIGDTVVLAPGDSLSSRIQVPSLHTIGQWVVQIRLYIPVESEFDDMLGGRVQTEPIEIEVRGER